MTTEAEIGVTCLQTKDHQGLPSFWHPPEAGRGRKDPPLDSSEGAPPCRHLEVGLPASRTGRDHTSVVLSPPSW